MLIFPETLIPAANEAQMAVPEDPNEFDPNIFPHFYVFCRLQLGRPMQPGEQFPNAKVIASVPEDVIRTFTLRNFIERGLSYGPILT